MNDERLIVAKEVDVDLRNEYLNKADGIVTAAGMSIFNAAIDRARCVVMRSPTIDAAPVVHGRWVRAASKSNIWYCSVCGDKINYKQNRRTYNIPKVPVEQKNKFCRNCGAKMDGGENCDQDTVQNAARHRSRTQMGVDAGGGRSDAARVERRQSNPQATETP